MTEQAITKMTAEVAAHEVAQVQALILRLNRRAAKAGHTSGITMTVGPEQRKTVTSEYLADVPQIRLEVLVHRVTLEVPSFIMDTGLHGAWEFIGLVRHIDGKPMVVNFGDDERVPVEWRGTRDCDHCKASRKRNKVFILRNTATGRLMRLGSTCVEEFAGIDCHDFIRNLGAWAMLVRRIEDMLRAGREYCDERWGGSTVRSFCLADFVARTSAAIRICGWRSRSETRDSGGLATADSVIFSYSNDPVERKEYALDVTEADRAKAAKVIAWVRALPNEQRNASDYLQNLFVSMEDDFVTPRWCGLAASGIRAWERAMNIERESRARAERTAESRHLGDLKQRLDLFVRVERVYTYEGDYGSVDFITMTTADGCEVMWKTGSSHGLHVGDWAMVRGTVKQHAEYRGTKQTVLTRCAAAVAVKAPDLADWGYNLYEE